MQYHLNLYGLSYWTKQGCETLCALKHVGVIMPNAWHFHSGVCPQRHGWVRVERLQELVVETRALAPPTTFEHAFAALV